MGAHVGGTARGYDRRGRDAARAVDEREVERPFEVFWTGEAAWDRR